MAEWCGGIFDLRNVNTHISNLKMSNIRIHDPYPTCPMFDVAGGFSDVTWENVHMAAHSTFRDLGYMFSKNAIDEAAKRRFFLPTSEIPEYELPPTGVPIRFVAAEQITNAGYVMDPSVKMKRISFNNVTVAGAKLSTLFTDPAYQGAVVTGGAKGSLDLTFDGVPFKGYPQQVPPSARRLSETNRRLSEVAQKLATRRV